MLVMTPIKQVIRHLPILKFNNLSCPLFRHLFQGSSPVEIFVCKDSRIHILEYQCIQIFQKSNMFVQKFLNGSHRCSTFGLAKSLFIQVSMSLSITKVTLYLTELSKVKSSNFFSLFDLLLVTLNL